MKNIVPAGLSGLILAFGLTTAVSAATVTVDVAGYTDLATAKADKAVIESGSTTIASEDFEGFTPVPTGGGAGDSTPLATGVGTFTSIPGSACGASCDAPEDEGLIRDHSFFGRFDTTTVEGPGEEESGQWLDSNDNDGLEWEISGLGEFDLLTFFLTDLDDVGEVTFSIDVGGTVFDIAADVFGGASQIDGSLFLVTIAFDMKIDSATISMLIDGGDGFGIDDIRIGLVPLPAAGLMLLAGLGGLGALRRRRKLA